MELLGSGLTSGWGCSSMGFCCWTGGLRPSPAPTLPPALPDELPCGEPAMYWYCIMNEEWDKPDTESVLPERVQVIPPAVPLQGTIISPASPQSKEKEAVAFS